MPLTSIDRIKAWASPNMDDSRDEMLERLVDAATAWVEREANWLAVERTHTVVLDGNDAMGHILLLPQKYRPVTHGDNAVTIAEDGVALSVGTGYSTSDTVVLRGADDANARLEMMKRGGAPWSSGVQNIVVMLTCGYADEDAAPADLVQVCTEVATLMFRTPASLGKSSKSTKGGSSSFAKELSPQSRQMLDRMRQEVI